MSIVGETPQLFPVLRGLWVFSFMRAECQTAHYGWFTEGFDTADLQEAKELLEELM